MSLRPGKAQYLVTAVRHYRTDPTGSGATVAERVGLVAEPVRINKPVCDLRRVVAINHSHRVPIMDQPEVVPHLVCQDRPPPICPSYRCTPRLHRENIHYSLTPDTGRPSCPYSRPAGPSLIWPKRNNDSYEIRANSLSQRMQGAAGLVQQVRQGRPRADIQIRLVVDALRGGPYAGPLQDDSVSRRPVVQQVVGGLEPFDAAPSDPRLRDSVGVKEQHADNDSLRRCRRFDPLVVDHRPRRRRTFRQVERRSAPVADRRLTVSGGDGQSAGSREQEKGSQNQLSRQERSSR